MKKLMNKKILILVIALDFQGHIMDHDLELNRLFSRSQDHQLLTQECKIHNVFDAPFSDRDNSFTLNDNDQLPLIPTSKYYFHAHE